jgi:sugar phosphate isomerase/epimerase
MNNLQVALELYTVRDETRQDFAGTLQRVANIGYAGVEFAGYGNLNSTEMSALLAQTKLKAVSTHLGLDKLEGPQLDASIRYCKDIDCSIIVMPSLPQEYRTQEGM